MIRSRQINYTQKTTILLSNLLVANLHNNPRSLKVIEARQLMLGALYESLIQIPGAFLSKKEIPSHVSAAETDKRVAFTKIKKGTRLFQFVRPGGWIGDYYAGLETITASELGASPQVTDPDDDTRVVDRIHIELIAIADGALQAGVTTAKPVMDSWSIKGQEVDTCGGAEQYYFPLVTAAKQATLVILKPADATPERIAILQAVADRNGLRLLTQEEIQNEFNINEFKSPYTRSTIAPNIRSAYTALGRLEMQTAINSALHRGAWQEAIEVLEQALTSTNNTLQPDLQALLGGLYGIVGRISDAQLFLNSFIRFYESNDSFDFQHEFRVMYEAALHHLALCQTNPAEAIECLKTLQQLTSSQSTGTSSSTEPNLNSQTALLELDMAIRYNQMAAQHTTELTYDDFDEAGAMIHHKLNPAKQAEIHLRQTLSSGHLATPELIIAQTELGFALKKQRKNLDALHYLLAAQEQLTSYRATIQDPQQLKDLDLQALGIRLAIGLILCRHDNPSLLPESLRQISRFDYMETLNQDLSSIDRMSCRLLFNRWLGRNEADLFMVGWYNDNNPSNQERGTSFIRHYREIFPLDIDRICDSLRENSITTLDLSYLGEEPPTGISDQKFTNLMSALAVNTSLKRVYLRKFSNSMNPFSQPYRRLPALANALISAHKAGQALTYLSYSASRYQSDEALTMANFLSKNKSLIVFQPSFYDIQSLKIFETYAKAIKNHPTLKTLLTGILTVKGAGSIIGKACEQAPSFKYLHPFPRALGANQAIELANNNALLKAKNNIDFKDSPIRATYFAELKTQISYYNLAHIRRGSRMYAAGRNRPGTEMEKIINQLTQGTCSFNEGIEKILSISKTLGKPHPIYTAANLCISMDRLEAGSSNSAGI